MDSPSSTDSSPAEIPVLQAEGLRMRFRDHVAVDGLSLELSPGSILGLVGPNGSGKTTTLRMIAGILPPLAGTVRISGFDLDTDPVPAKQRTAYVADDPKLFDALTVWEHIRFTAALYRVDDYERQALELLEKFDLEDKRYAVCGALSRGMRHKLGICCALLHKPQLLMLDEPLAGLDPRAIRRIKAIIRDRAQSGSAVIISSHLLHLIEDLCTGLLVLYKGRTRYRGSVADFRHSRSGDNDESLEDVFLAITSSDDPNDKASP